MNPHWGDIKDSEVLISFQKEEYEGRAELDRALKHLDGKLEELANLKGQLEVYDLENITFPGIRGKHWFSANEEDDSKKTICIRQAIPTKWIAHWFREEEWGKKRRTWREKKEHTPPSLGQTFTLVNRKDEQEYAYLFKPASDKADADPYLDKVRWQGVKMSL